MGRYQENVLGYRGMIISTANDELLPSNVPSHFRIGGAFAQEFALKSAGLPHLHADESDEAIRWLLSTAKRSLDDELLSYVEDTLHLSKQGNHEETITLHEDDEHDIEAASKLAAACIIANTAYNPSYWNNPSTQPYNNCYNYAMNHRSNTFAQPGRRSGHPNSIMQCPNVATAANWDGCKAVCSGSNKNVALVIWPGRDYHWYRRHSEGFWGHKPGSTAARNTDNAGNIINGTTRTPQNCDRGPYTQFCGYRFSPTGMIVS